MSQTEQNQENSLILSVRKNLENFIESINCLRETYGYSVEMLEKQREKANKVHAAFISKFVTKEKEGSICVPIEKIRQFESVKKTYHRAEKAFSLIPPTYIVSLISIYDSFYAGLVRSVYQLKPGILCNCEKAFLYRDLQNFEVLSEVKACIIDDTIEGLLRDSHTKQIDWLEKVLDIKTLKQFEGWGNFIELTERRNLFVHSDGIVSSQYLSECSKWNVSVGDLSLGAKLSVDRDYFNAAYKLLYAMAIKLSVILINKLYVEAFKKDEAVRDTLIINSVYELICDELYDVAIDVSQFALGSVFKRNAIDRIYIVLNLAQSYKWSGQQDKCLQLLQSEDTTTWKYELIIIKLTLEERYDEVYDKMKSQGNNGEILKKECYREWPIFKLIRQEEEFALVFEEIFSEKLIDDSSIIEVNKPEPEIENSISITGD